MITKDFTISYNDEELLKNLDMENFTCDLEEIVQGIESCNDKETDFDTCFEELGKKLYGRPIKNICT